MKIPKKIIYTEVKKDTNKKKINLNITKFSLTEASKYNK